MKKLIGLGAFLLLSLVAYAAPISDYTWTPPTNYVDGTVIDPVADTLTYNLYCSDTPGGPYSVAATLLSGDFANGIDVASCVNGVPGTYYFVLTAVSSLYNAESGNSNEVSRTYTAFDLGKVPNAPVLLTVQ